MQSSLYHLAIRVNKQMDIDKCVEFLKDLDTSTLFGTPKHREDFVDSAEDTYYQIMFESPDKILFEVVYVGRS
jgi:hypothetical protein